MARNTREHCQRDGDGLGEALGLRDGDAMGLRAVSKASQRISLCGSQLCSIHTAFVELRTRTETSLSLSLLAAPV